MAKATKKIKDISITLELSLEEAIVLYWVVERIGGSPDHTARKYMNAIQDSLRTINVRSDINDDYIESPYTAIYFTNESLDKLKSEVEKFNNV